MGSKIGAADPNYPKIQGLSRLSRLSYGIAASYETSNGPISIIEDDFNRDGAQDVAVAASSSRAINVLLDDNTGRLGTRIDLPAGGSPLEIGPGDFNGNGHRDLVAALGRGEFNWFSGDGTGNFGAAQVVSLPGSVRVESIAVADVDQDGREDVACLDTQGGNLYLVPSHWGWHVWRGQCAPRGRRGPVRPSGPSER